MNGGLALPPTEMAKMKARAAQQEHDARLKAHLTNTKIGIITQLASQVWSPDDPESFEFVVKRCGELADNLMESVGLPTIVVNENGENGEGSTSP